MDDKRMIDVCMMKCIIDGWIDEWMDDMIGGWMAG